MKIVAQERCTKQKNAGTIACQHQNKQYIRVSMNTKKYEDQAKRVLGNMGK
jgi:hypothetical protein